MDGFYLQNILESILGSYKRGRDELIFYCPFCNHKNPKLYVHVSRNMCHCFVCDYSSSIIKLLKKLNIDKETISNVSQYYHKNPVKVKPNIEEELIDSILNDENKSENELKINQKLQEKLNLVARPLLFNSVMPTDKSILKYLHNRGVTNDDIIRYNLMIGTRDKFQNTLVIPSYNIDGYLNFFQSRTIKRKVYIEDDEEQVEPPTYINCSIKRTNIIFDEIYINWDEDLYIVEGFFDHLKLDRNSFCLLGSNININHIGFQYLLSHTKNKYICLDEDAQFKALNIATNLMRYGIHNVYLLDWKKIRKNQLYDNIRDIGDITDRELIDEFIHNNVYEINLGNKDELTLNNLIENI